MFRSVTRSIVLLSVFVPISLPSQNPKLPVVSIQTAPKLPIVESRNTAQFLNFDLVVRNISPITLRISQIQLTVYDSTHELTLMKSVNTDAFAPSIAVIGNQILGPGESLDIFNPFPEFEAIVPLIDLQYSFCLLRESNPEEEGENRHRLPDDCDFREVIIINPRTYRDETALVLPLRGRIFVWEGHDLYAHHLRVPLSSSRIKALGITANSNDFASDFIYVNPRGEKYRGDARKLENWFSYGKPIYAPGAGVILASANNIPDNWFTNATATNIGRPHLASGEDPKDIGNFVLIDHQNGEYSLLVHMKQGSVTVRPGERVARGVLIGRIGFSGDSIFPHLHYSLMDGRQVFKAWGLPAYFMDFNRILGTRSLAVKLGPVDTGDFVESEAAYSEVK